MKGMQDSGSRIQGRAAMQINRGNPRKRRLRIVKLMYGLGWSMVVLYSQRLQRWLISGSAG